MSMIAVENLTFAYPSSYDNIFENVSFCIDTDWKLGFVGRNGRGKTTFLNLLRGLYDYRGHITSNVRFDYFPYPVADPERFTQEVLEEIAPDAADWELRRELTLLEVDADVLWRPFSTLSNGEQTKVLLAALFLNEGHFLLIDEPTNHLDMRARESVAAYLRGKKGFILVSHDRRFLDGCVDHILSINRTNIEIQSGNFTSWMENFERAQNSELARNARLKKDMGRMKEAARRAANWSDRAESAKVGTGCADRGYVGHKAAKMMNRAKAIEARRMQAAEEKEGLLKNLETAEALKLHPLRYHAQTLLTLRDVVIDYDGREVCPPVTLALQRGQRLALDGKNGSGKSSLLKLMMGMPIPHSGQVLMGSGLIVSYVPQDTSFLRGSLTEYASFCGIDESLFKAILRKMDFERVQFEKDMSSFSAGQKKKVLLSASLCAQAHLYIWDEPLNYIDVYSRMQIEQLLTAYAPTMIFVEHDRAFRENIATDTYVL